MSKELDGHELLCIQWPQTDASGVGYGPLTEVFFKFCDDNSISIGSQLMLLALFEEAGADLSAGINEQGLDQALNRLKERAPGLFKFNTIEGYSDQ